MPQRSDVRPITHLKNHTAELIREVNEAGRPVTITQNGEAKVVVMDVDQYDDWRASLALLKLVALGEADATAGRAVPQRKAFARARATLAAARKDG